MKWTGEDVLAAIEDAFVSMVETLMPEHFASKQVDDDTIHKSKKVLDEDDILCGDEEDDVAAQKLKAYEEMIMQTPVDEEIYAPVTVEEREPQFVRRAEQPTATAEQKLPANNKKAKKQAKKKPKAAAAARTPAAAKQHVPKRLAKVSHRPAAIRV